MAMTTDGKINRRIGAIKGRMIDRLTDIVIDESLSIINDTIKKHFGEEFDFSNLSIHRIEVIKKFIARYAPEKKKVVDKLSDTRIVFFIDKNTFFYFVAGNKLFSSVDKIMMVKEMDHGINHNSCYIYIGGKNYKKYYNKLKLEFDKEKESLYTYNVSANTDNGNNIICVANDMKIRDIDTLFFDDIIKKEIIGHVDNYIKNSDIYNKRNIRYKTGILLYGEPGTGKTSLTNAIATYYGRDMVIVDMPSFINLDIAELKNSIEVDDKKFVVVLEDIDCIFDSMNRESDKSNSKDNTLIGKFLQFLDSNDSPSDVIFIATTNHMDNIETADIDKALLRDGRFDLKLNILGIDYNKACKMIESFGIEEKYHDTILSAYDKKSKINQSNLQNKIFNFIKENPDLHYKV